MSPADDSNKRPRIWLPPPLLFGAGLLAAWALERSDPFPLVSPDSETTLEVIGWVLCALGAGLAAWAIATFGIERTPVLPTAPARTVVDSGPYRFSRNPIYVGLIVIYAGAALTMNSSWAVVLLPVALVVLYYLVVRREEEHLHERFGETYEAYRRRVRRWL